MVKFFADRYEQSALVSDRADPADLRQPCLQVPVVRVACKEIFRIAVQQSAGIGAQIFNAVLREPLLHLAEGVAVFLRVLILIADPRFAPLRLTTTIV